MIDAHRTPMPAPRWWIAALLLAAPLLSPRPAGAQVDDRLQARIDEAIRKGREALLPDLRSLAAKPPSDYPMGRVALPLAAALRAGLSPDDPAVKAAFARLDTMPLAKTYSVACYLFALDAWWRAGKGRLGALAGRTAVAPDAAGGELREKIAKAVQWLVEARAEGKGYWSYDPQGPGSGRHDYSNTQFAVLGLQIGLEHRVPIPREVFEEIAARFVGSLTQQGKAREIRVTKSPDTEEILEQRMSAGGSRTRPVGAGDSTTQVAKLTPGGWAYTQSRSDPYASMTAAGASSLLVALNGLGNSGGRLRTQAQAALFSAYGWISDNFASYIRGTRHYYYTLYSLEKVGDLGEIAKFDAHDWYAEGARELVDRQRSDGSWGNYVDTSLALLFLTRATRLKPTAPAILTRSQGEEGTSDLSADYVYISRLEGFVSAREVLRFIGSSRRASLVAVGREVVRNYALGAQGDLVPPLLELWAPVSDSVTRFARESLEEITGIRSRDPAEYAAWHRAFARISALRKKKNASVEEVAAQLRSTDNIALKSAVLDVAQRHGMTELVEPLIGELAVDSIAYRRRVHGLLTLWTGRARAAPADGDKEGWDVEARRWREWWAEDGPSFLARREVIRRIDRLEAITSSGLIVRGGATEKEANELVGAIAQAGETAEAEIRRRLRAREHSIFLVEALERIRGEPLGLRARSLAEP
ncbi:MAG: hypothetical protein JXA90_02255 [Planctomycetes bacterium]|nr:hypothetical protein [Planctomycetota bacterium]